MSLANAILAVAQNPTSVQHRVTLAAIVQSFHPTFGSAIWGATTRFAVSRGQFFPALLLAHKYLDEQTQLKIFSEMAVRYGADQAENAAYIPPPMVPAIDVEPLPTAHDALLKLAHRIGTSLDGLLLPEHARMPEIPNFHELPAVEFVTLAGALQEVTFGEGDILLQQGDTEQSIYLLAYGSVKVTKTRPDGTFVELAEVSAPAIMGEMSLLTDVPRRATVTAMGTGMAWKIGARLMGVLNREHPKVVEHLLGIIKKRLLTNVIRSSRVFNDVEEHEILLQHFDVMTVKADTEVFAQGAPPPGLFVILHGEAEVWTEDEEEARVRVATLNEGDAFGEFSLLTEQPTTASVWMPDGGVLLHLPAQRFQQIRGAVPTLDEELTAMMDVRRGELQAIAYSFGDGFEGFTIEEVTELDSLL